jgi:hypothetical protein
MVIDKEDTLLKVIDETSKRLLVDDYIDEG